MDNNSDKNKEIICLSNRLIIHSVIFAVLLIIHIVIYLAINWMKNLIKVLFLSFSFIGVIYILISIIPFILIKTNQLQLRVKYFKIISKILFFLSLLIGLFFFIIIIINTYLVKDFCIECPFNLNFSNFVSNFDENFENKEEYTIKRNCRERRCLFNKYEKNSSYTYLYLCNYDPEEEFGVKDGERKQIKCQLFEPLYRDVYFTDETKIKTIFKYLDKCFNLTNFYYCARLQEPKEYKLEEDEKCPKKDYIYYMYFLIIYIFIFDVVINIIIWYLQVNSYNSFSRIKFQSINTINNNNNNTNNNNKNTNNANNNNTNNNNQIGTTNNENNENINSQNNNVVNNKEDSNSQKKINIFKSTNIITHYINICLNNFKREETLGNKDLDFNPCTRIITYSRNKKNEDNYKDKSNTNTNENIYNTSRPFSQNN